ncbi:MAG: T9SS type A sorting domain-containing protein [Bacteroidia bacterium]|nr:T9SS type A sorting domain-containing protein [Bacteroidia bacterium]
MIQLFRLFPALLLLVCLLHPSAYAQLSVPEAEAVYGGRIRSITGIATAADSSRIFITTESANTAFFADVYHPGPDTAVFSAFQPMPDMSAAANLGSQVSEIAAHAGSGRLFFLHQGQVKSASPAGGGLRSYPGGGPSSLLIQGDYLLYLTGNRLVFGQLDAAGNFIQPPASPYIFSGPGPGPGVPRMAVSPLSGLLYLYLGGASPKLFVSSDPYDAIKSTTVFADISPAGLPAWGEWRAFGIGPDGRLFIAGSDFSHKTLAYSDDGTAWTAYRLPFGGAPGEILSFGGDSASYYVYYANAYNSSQGDSCCWQGFGIPGGFETHPNDGAVYADPAGPRVVYMTTDQGIGASVNGGSRIFEINDGVEAVQVNDFAMHLSDKNHAWIASKAGVRKVSDYRSSPVWSPAMFPNGDGSPYYSVAMAGTDPDKAYAGNVRVYKTGNGGASWRRVFSAELAPYNYASAGTPATGAAWVTSIAVCEWDTSIVFAGYAIDGSDEGGLFYSMDGGASWSQLLLEASAVGKDVDVRDIVFSQEGGSTVVYAGVSYDLSSPQGRSVYRVEQVAGSWVVSQDMDGAGTSTGSPITATITSLYRSSTGDTLAACGTDAGINHPVAYYKILSGSGQWTPFATSGFPFFPGKQGKAVTIGKDTVYVAVDHEVYLLAAGSSTWIKGYTYPNGTQIQFLFYDELLVGTGTGLYGHDGIAGGSTAAEPARVSGLRVSPNPVSGMPLRVSWDNAPAGPASAVLRDLSGRVLHIRKTAYSGDIELPAAWFGTPGVYLLEIQAGNRRETVRVLVR